MDTNYNQMKLELEEMEKKYSEVLNELDDLIYHCYLSSLNERRGISHFNTKEELAHHLSWIAKQKASLWGLYPFDKNGENYPSST